MSSTVQLILLLLVLIGVAKIGGALSAALGQPTVLGKLLAGVLLGPSLINVMHWETFQSSDLKSTIHYLSELGVIFLMFIAGLRIEAHELREAGKAATWTAILGVVIPFLGGLFSALAFGYGLILAIFVGLLLTATSVSISAQTLVELGRLKSRVGTTLLGAAVLDDIIGLLLLSIFMATQTSDGNFMTIVWTIVRLVGFLVVAWFLGQRFLPRILERVKKMRTNEPVLTFAVLVVLGLAFTAETVGHLAAITGAFMAGILLSHTDVRDEIDRSISSFTYAVLVPIFFIGIGLNTDLSSLSGAAIPMAIILCIVAIGTKIVGCGLGAKIAGLNQREAIQVGCGMISRGEVGLIVASLGVQNQIVDTNVFSLTVAVVLVTTLVTPILLKWSFKTEPLPSLHLALEPEDEVLAIG